MANIFQAWLHRIRDRGQARFLLTERHDYQVSKLPAELKDTVSSAGSIFGVFASRATTAISPYNPDSLVQRKGIKIYRQMLTDEQVKAALSAKKFAVLSTGYEIQVARTPDGGDQEAADEHKRFVEFNFDEMAGSFDSKILDLMSALDFGYSVAEKLFWAIDYGEFEGKWGLKDLKTRPPDDMLFGMDAFGDLVENGVEQFGIKLPRDKFCVYSYNSTFGNPYGNSDLRAVYRQYWLKDVVLKLMSASLERYGEPIADISYEGTIDTPQRADLEAFLVNLQSRSGLIHSKNITLDFKTPPPRSAEAFIPAINLYDQGIRIGILMPGLMGLSGEQTTGSYARAVKEFDVFLWILGQLRKDLETVINEQVVKPLLDLNYEIEHGQYPQFKFKEVTEEAKRQQFEMFIMGLSGGALNKGPDDENKLRELINFEPLPKGFVPPQPPGMGGLFAPNGNGGGPGSNGKGQAELPFETSDEGALPGMGGGDNQGIKQPIGAAKSKTAKMTDDRLGSGSARPLLFSVDNEAEMIEFVANITEHHEYTEWDESKHPRATAGSSEGGQFISGGGEGGGSSGNGNKDDKEVDPFPDVTRNGVAIIRAKGWKVIAHRPYSDPPTRGEAFIFQHEKGFFSGMTLAARWKQGKEGGLYWNAAVRVDTIDKAKEAMNRDVGGFRESFNWRDIKN